MDIMDNDTCFYVPGKLCIIDAITMVDGTPYGTWSGETLEEIQARHPGAEVWDFDAAYAAMQAAYIKAPVEITRARFWEMLEILPPKNWRQHRDSESFMMIEHTIGNITSIFVRLELRYFEMTGDASLTHDEIMAKIDNFIEGGTTA